MSYIKLLVTFVLTVLMDKTEYNFFHKNFRPVKLIIITGFLCNVVFTGYLLVKLNRIHEVIVEQCPNILIREGKETPVTPPSDLPV